MTRLIDADYVKEHMRASELNGRQLHIMELEERLAVIDEVPTVDAVPVRHGKWIDLETFKRPWFRHHIFECSVCRNTLDMDGVNAGRGDANYCPNCGAKMDEEKEE